jgi:hypothetical protein
MPRSGSRNRWNPVALCDNSRHVPNAVARAVWERDGMRCAALGGPATVENLAVRCRQHNHYESELVYGLLRGITTARPS